MSEPSNIDMKRIERINIMIKEQNISQAQFARSIEMTPENLSRIINRHVNFTETTAERIISYYPEYNLEWLLGYSDLKTQEEKDRADLEWCNDILEKHNRQAEAVWCLIDGALNKSGLSLKFCHRSGQHLDSHERFKKECYYSIVDESGNEVKRLTAEEQFRLERKIQRICEILTDDLLNPVSIFS